MNIRNAPTRLMKNLGYGKGYEMYPETDDLLPEKLRGKKVLSGVELSRSTSSISVRSLMSRIALIILLTAACAYSQTTGDVVSTREMDRINWMEFKETVPSKIDTVLLPTGTLEPHGVVNNGADNTAPSAMAKDDRSPERTR
jgi:hypothetical protein